MLDKAVRKTFINLIGRYRLAQTRCQLKSDEICNMAKRIGGYADSGILAQVIKSVPFESPLRYALFRRYDELIERASDEISPQNCVKKSASLDQWTQNTLKRLASEYKLLLDRKMSLQEEIFGLAESCGANDDMEAMDELVSLAKFPCFVRFRLVHQQLALKDRAKREHFITRGEELPHTMNAEERVRYFQELALNLQHEGLTVKPETEEGLLPVELEGRRLCLALETGGVRYWKEDAADSGRSEALDRVTAIAGTTAAYMSQMAAAPQLTASGLEGDYRLLAEFNNVVLAGHPTKYGVQFITWERVREGTALYQGDYYGPGAGADSCAAARQDFAVRSGLVPRSALFTPEQLTEIHRSIQEALENRCPMTDERTKCLQSAAEQIERGVPDLDLRVRLSIQKECEFAMEASPDNSGMQFS